MSEPDELADVEQLLADLPTREPSQLLDHRIATTLSARRRSLGPRLAVAAAVLITSGLGLAAVLKQPTQQPDVDGTLTQDQGQADNPAMVESQAHQVEPGPRFDIAPVALTWSRDIVDQPRTAPNGRPYRAVVRESVDQRVWIDPETGATFEITTPRRALYVVEQPVY